VTGCLEKYGRLVASILVRGLMDRCLVTELTCGPTAMCILASGEIIKCVAMGGTIGVMGKVLSAIF